MPVNFLKFLIVGWSDQIKKFLRGLCYSRTSLVEVFYGTLTFLRFVYVHNKKRILMASSSFFFFALLLTEHWQPCLRDHNCFRAGCGLGYKQRQQTNDNESEPFSILMKLKIRTVYISQNIFAFPDISGLFFPRSRICYITDRLMIKKIIKKQSILPSLLVAPAVWPDCFPALSSVSRTDLVIYTPR